MTHRIMLGKVPVGGDAPVTVQSMTKTDTRDVETTVAQIQELEEAGCEIIRTAVPDAEAATALEKICKRISIPLVADIHFDHRLALTAIDSGADGLRINPGNIGSPQKVKEIVKAAEPRKIPIRIGVNAGSLEKSLLEKYSGATPEAMVESAMNHVRILEDAGYGEIKISVKASDVKRTVEAYRLLSTRTDHPLHLGVTEAGTLMAGTIRSAAAMGILLSQGIGDTIRVSLTEHPVQEVKAGIQILRCMDLRPPGADVISCPTCGRIQIDVIALAHEVEEELERYYAANPEAPQPCVAVMGCMVNGPGEAREADIAIAGGKGKAALYLHGEHIKTVPEEAIVKELMEQVRGYAP